MTKTQDLDEIVEEIEQQNFNAELIAMIDSGLKDFLSRSLVSSDEIVNFLLDVRLQLSNQ